MPATVSNFTQQLSELTAPATGDQIVVQDVSAAVPTYMTLANLTKSAGTPVAIGDVTTYAMLAANSGRLHALADVASSTTITLPTPAAGLVYEWIYTGAAADAQNHIITSGSDTNYFKGGVVHLDADSGTGADEVVPVISDGNSNSKLTLVTPSVGTWVKMWCDGTIWYLTGTVVSATAPTLGDQ